METLRHGGNLTNLSRIAGLPPGQILDFSANVNPLGPPEWLRTVVSSTLGSVVHYPDPDCTALVQAVSRRYKVEAQEVIFGNGSTEIIHLLPRALNFKSALIPVPCYSDYLVSTRAAGLKVRTLLMREGDGFRLDLNGLESCLKGDELVFLCQPNNPTGLTFDAESLRQLAARRPSTLFVVDEAFGDFVEDMKSLVNDRPDNVVVLISLTKIFAIPGLRLGVGIANKEVVKAVKSVQPSWSVNSLAQAVGEAALQDNEYVERSRAYVSVQRPVLKADLDSIPGLTVYDGLANFLLCKIERDDANAFTIADRMLQDGVAIRVCANFEGLDKRFFRVAVRTERENRRLGDSLRKAFGLSTAKPQKSRPHALMFQGTSSNAGKSVLTAALCRILLQDGFSPAPFKAQNMSLNSFVTRDGGEMGRAQVVQAQASRLEPDVRMNPILLKPNSDTGSQVIVMGKPVSNMDVTEYVNYKPVAFQTVREAYDSLAREHDVVVLEGAGSPGEVNLKHHDIVNMQMAKYAGARVLLAGDIDRGGVFASFVGTMEVLTEWERALVAGFVVNRFRGKKDLLISALEFTLKRTGRPVLGVVPYLADLGLPEEDSVSFKDGAFDTCQSHDECVEIAVVDLPHISNFTDFDAFRVEPDVRVRRVRHADDLDSADAVILPGSKNVIGDLEYLRDKGLDRKIEKLVRSGRMELIGMCGGFQMIGDRIADPHCLESDGKTLQGMGFLNLTTVLASEKTLTRVTAVHEESGKTVSGYEIHHGRSEASDLAPVVRFHNGETAGPAAADGLVWGTYLHGIFDADEFRRWFIDRLRVRRGLKPKGEVCARYDLEPALDRLADTVRNTMDMEALYRLMGL